VRCDTREVNSVEKIEDKKKKCERDMLSREGRRDATLKSQSEVNEGQRKEV
jgi:hypothetical protein